MGFALATLLGIAIAGLAASAIAHFASLIGIVMPGLESVAFPGLFVVWLPTILLAHRLSADFPRRDLWKASLRGAPKWVVRAIMAVAVYAGLNFFLLLTAPESELTKVRLLSGHATVFYAVAAGVAYSAWRLSKVDVDRRCTQGHIVSPTARFCEKCGSPVINPGMREDSAS